MRILVMEDEPDIARPVVDDLRDDRYDVVWAPDLEAAQAAVDATPFDLLILDVMIAGREDAGFTLADEVRGVGFEGRIMFLTARDAVEDRIRGLDIGGDDYVLKPFSLEELRARVRALLRRTAQTKRAVVDRQSLHVDLVCRRVRWEDREVVLSDREFAMLELFALHPERVFAVDDLLDRFFPDATSGRRVVRVYVSQLRHKVARRVIETVAGGYRLGWA